MARGLAGGEPMDGVNLLPSETLTFTDPPEIPLWRAALRRPVLAPGGTIPAIEARCETLWSGGASPTLSAYAAICGFPRTDPLPVSFPSVLFRGLELAVLTAPTFPLPVLGVVHVRERIEQLRPIGAHERLSGTVRVEGHRVVRAGGELDLRCTLLAGEEVVWRGITTILTRSIRGAGDRTPIPPESPLRPERSVRWRIPADLGRRYARVNGDRNPIHLWPLTARMFGFRRPIAHGWWVLSRALAELDDAVPPACVVEAAFLSPISMPTTVTFEAGPGPSEGGWRFQVRGAPRGEKDPRCVVGSVVGRPGA